MALVAALSDAGLRRSEASSLTWGDVQRWDDGSGRITAIRSKTDVEAAGAVVAITPAAMQALDAIRPVGVGGEVKVFGVTVQTCGDLPTIRPIVEGQPSTVFPLQTVSVPSNVNSYCSGCRSLRSPGG